MKWNKWKLLIFLTMPALFIGIVVVEIGLRLWWDAKSFVGHFSSAAPEIAWFSKHVKMNRLGFRGDFKPYEKPPGTYRLVVLGDSVTFGYGINKVEKRYPELLAGMLSKKLGTNVEAINLGRPGLSTFHEFNIMHDKGQFFHPDVVILGYYYNDPITKSQGDVIVKHLGYPPWIKFLTKRSYLVSFMGYFLMNNKQDEIIENCIHYVNSPNNPTEPEFRVALESIYELSRKQGADYVVIIFPILEGLEKEPYEFQDADDYIVMELKSLGIPYVDLLPLLKRRNSRELWASDLDSHPNEEVHAIAASALMPIVEPMIEKRIKNNTRLHY